MSSGGRIRNEYNSGLSSRLYDQRALELQRAQNRGLAAGKGGVARNTPAAVDLTGSISASPTEIGQGSPATEGRSCEGCGAPSGSDKNTTEEG